MGKKTSLLDWLDPEFLSEKADDLSVKFENKAEEIREKSPYYIPKPKSPFKHWRRDRRIEKRIEKRNKSKNK